ncbi:anti-sigma factor [Streptomyces tauricus]|uniref:anti-sigma factor n=1 Tax=Streptomyces tauricus TaxID=68274 RepID=UPI0022433B7E|nr:anti-sigma factor [Streptomyces tauricus]MCW8103329.1 anti-sigma factor [Streptomyces tauricus]
MTSHVHSHDELLGAHALGILEPAEQSRLEEEIAACEVCQVELADLKALEAELGDVPPEAFLEGPPEGADLLLQRTLRQVRGEYSTVWRRKVASVSLVAAALAGVLLTAGYFAGHAQKSTEASGPEVSAGPSAPEAGESISATDGETKAKMTVSLTPAAGWVRVNALVSGLQPGENCRLVVVSESGEREIAGSWVVGSSKEGKAKDSGLELSGSAAIAPDQVDSVVVENDQGKRYVTVAL